MDEEVAAAFVLEEEGPGGQRAVVALPEVKVATVGGFVGREVGDEVEEAGGQVGGGTGGLPAEAQELARTLDAAAVHRRTGCPLHASFWPAKLLWLRRHGPWLERGARVVSVSDVALGEPTTSVSVEPPSPSFDPPSSGSPDAHPARATVAPTATAASATSRPFPAVIMFDSLLGWVAPVPLGAGSAGNGVRWPSRPARRRAPRGAA